jgi:hypothetical protein
VNFKNRQLFFPLEQVSRSYTPQKHMSCPTKCGVLIMVLVVLVILSGPERYFVRLFRACLQVASLKELLV